MSVKLNANRLKLKNLFFIYIVLVSVPSMRMLAHQLADRSGSAGWLAPIVGGILFVPVILCTYYVVRSNPGKGLADINTAVLGTAMGRVFNIIYAVWFVVLSSYHLRQFGERMVSTVFLSSTSIGFIVAMVLCVAYALRLGATVTLRASSLFFFCIIGVFLFSMIGLIPNVRVENLLPISPLDTVPLLQSTVYVFAALTFLCVILVFLGEAEGGHFLRHSFVSTAVAVLVMVTATLIPIGIFSSSVVSQMQFPFFSAVKDLQLFKPIERVEAIVLSLLILADFVIIAVFALGAHKLLCRTAGASEETPTFNMLMLLIFVSSLFFNIGSRTFDELSEMIVVPAGIGLGIGLPVLTFAVCLVKRLRQNARQKAQYAK